MDSTSGANHIQSGRCLSCGQLLPDSDLRKRRRFIWGVVLAWFPFLILLIGLRNAFKEVSTQKATGLGAVAGGLSEIGVMLGIFIMVAVPIAGMVLLLRSFSKGHALRGFVAVVSIAWSGLILLLGSLAVRWALSGLRR